MELFLVDDCEDIPLGPFWGSQRSNTNCPPWTGRSREGWSLRAGSRMKTRMEDRISSTRNGTTS